MTTANGPGTATGVALLGALYASGVTAATRHALAGVSAPPDAARRLAAAVASGAGTRVAALVPPPVQHQVQQPAEPDTQPGSHAAEKR